MTALRLKQGTLSLEHQEELRLGPLEQNCIVIRVAYSGLCGSDLHMLLGEFPTAATHPLWQDRGLILGHEISGHVLQIGTLVDPVIFPVGAAVTVNPNGQCGQCKNCGIGRPHFCAEMKVPGKGPIGVYQNGGWATFVKVPAYQVFILPKGLDVREAVLSEPFSCVLRGYRQLVSNMRADTRILILGGGIVGILWCILLEHRGYRKITVSEPSEERRNIINNIQLRGLVTVDPLELPRPQAEGGSFDVVVDCSGFPPAISHAIPLLDVGGVILLFGCCPKGRKMDIEPFEIFDRELTIIGAKVNPFTFYEAVQLMADLSDKLKFEHLGIEEFELEDYENALDRLKKRVISKAVYQFGKKTVTR